MTLPKDPIKREAYLKANRERPLGKKASDETKLKMSLKRKGVPKSEAHKQKLREAKLGIPRPMEVRIKLSEAHKGKCFWTPEGFERMRKLHSGAGNPAWDNGKSFEPYCPKFNKEFKERVRAFFNHCCVECGTKQNGTKLDVHHVNFNKKSCCDDTIPLFVSLCKSCHSMIKKPNLEYWQQHYTDLVQQGYGGKCYLSREEYLALFQKI